MYTNPVAVLEVSAVLVACTLTDAVAGKSAGAVKRPPALIVPTVALPPEMPFTLHLTDVFVRLLVESLTVAMKV